MNTTQPIIIVIYLLTISLLFSSCGPGQLFGPTPTPVPTTGTIDGHVILQGGGAVSDAPVILFDETIVFEETYPENNGSEIKTDANGSYTFDEIEPGKYALGVEVPVSGSDGKCMIFAFGTVDAGVKTVVDIELPSNHNARQGWNLTANGNMVRCEFPE